MLTDLPTVARNMEPLRLYVYVTMCAVYVVAPLRGSLCDAMQSALILCDRPTHAGADVVAGFRGTCLCMGC